MSSSLLKIAFHGLIALAPTFDAQNGINYMTALLIDARTPHGGVCMDDARSEHHPRLRFVAAATAECFQAGCQSTGNICDCREAELAGKHVFLEFASQLPNAAAQPLGSQHPPSILPANPVQAADFSYVANLAQEPFGLSLDPGYLADPPPAEQLEHLLTRMKVRFDEATACDLATREDGGIAYVHAMSFRELNHPSSQTEVSQALAQKVILELSVPDSTAVRIVIRDFSDPGGVNAKRILLLRRLSGYHVDLSNQPNFPLDYDDPCNDGVARHFEMYYRLASSQPPAVLLPHVRFTKFIPETEVEPEICKERFFGLIDRPICPIGNFNP